MEIDAGITHSLQKPSQASHRLSCQGSSVFAARLGLLVSGKQPDAGQPMLMALYDLGQSAGHHLSYLAHVFQADATVSGTGHAVVEGAASAVKDGLPPLARAPGNAMLAMSQSPLNALPEKAFHECIDSSTKWRSLAGHLGSHCPERRWQLLKHPEGGAALFVRDYCLAIDEQADLIETMRKGMAAVSQAVETIWLNGRTVWTAAPEISHGLTGGQHGN